MATLLPCALPPALSVMTARTAVTTADAARRMKISLVTERSSVCRPAMPGNGHARSIDAKSRRWRGGGGGNANDVSTSHQVCRFASTARGYARVPEMTRRSFMKVMIRNCTSLAVVGLALVCSAEDPGTISLGGARIVIPPPAGFKDVMSNPDAQWLAQAY